MGRGTVAIVLALIGLADVARGADYGQRSLAGLAAVRLEVTTAGASDSVDTEVFVAAKLRTAGIFMRREASEVLRVATTVTDGAVAADVSLVQAVCLERDPFVTVLVATWFSGRSERSGEEAQAGRLLEGILETLVDQFIRDWEAANPVR